MSVHVSEHAHSYLIHDRDEYLPSTSMIQSYSLGDLAVGDRSSERVSGTFGATVVTG